MCWGSLVKLLTFRKHAREHTDHRTLILTTNYPHTHTQTHTHTDLGDEDNDDTVLLLGGTELWHQRAERVGQVGVNLPLNAGNPHHYGDCNTHTQREQKGAFRWRHCFCHRAVMRAATEERADGGESAEKTDEEQQSSKNIDRWTIVYTQEDSSTNIQQQTTGRSKVTEAAISLLAYGSY